MLCPWVIYYSLFVSFSNFWPRNKLQKLSLLYFVVCIRDEFSSSFAVIYTHISVSTHAWTHFPIKCHRETHKTQVLIDNSHAIRASLTWRCCYLDGWFEDESAIIKSSVFFPPFPCSRVKFCFVVDDPCAIIICTWWALGTQYSMAFPWKGFLEVLRIWKWFPLHLYMGNIQMLSSANPLVVHCLETKIF